MNNLNSLRGLSFRPSDEVEVTIATNAGACFGVVRAIKLGFQAVEKSAGTVHSLGPLIHNPHVVRELKDRGVLTVESADEVASGTVVLRSHGVRHEIETELRDKGVQIVDATCPLVKKPQRIARAVGESGAFLVLVGDQNHPEVKGVLSYFGRPDYLVTYKEEDIATIPDGVTRVAILAQTTIEVAVLDAIARKVRARFPDTTVYNTICDATSVRQTEAATLAAQADVVVVVGGKNSSNTNKLVKICKQYQPDTYHVEDYAEIEAAWFRGKKKIAVTAGASTPHEFVDKAGRHIVSLLA